MTAKSMKPRLYADILLSTVNRAAASGSVLAVAAEASRIARETGISESLATLELIETGLAAGVAVRAPDPQALDAIHGVHAHARARVAALLGRQPAA